MKSFLSKIKEIKLIEALAITGNKRISPSDLLKRVSTILSKEKINFSVAGGFARSIHAEPRATGDVDIVIATNNIKEVENILIKNGFTLGDVLDYSNPKRIIRKYVFKGREVDVIEYPNNSKFVDFLLSTSISQALFGTTYSFLGLEGLIITKLCSFRFKDKADLVDLIEKNPNLDIIKEWCIDLKILDRFSFLQEKHENEH